MTDDGPRSAARGRIGDQIRRPKALARDPDGSAWLLRSVVALKPCDAITVVLGAGADEAAAMLPMSVRRVLARDWVDGMAASLKAGLESLDGETACLVSLVDLPDVDAAVTQRMLRTPITAATLRRATYDGVPGHPVLLGRDHWAGVIATAQGDQGARDYLRRHDELVGGDRMR